MSEPVQVLKDEEGQRPIPSEWRSTFAAIVDAIKESDFQLAGGIAGVRPISAATAKAITENIKGYGAQLTNLSEESWRTSACQWIGSYWDVLVDLFTIEEGASDLALAVRVYETGTGYSFEVLSVHVP